jgi:hypothetical protein
MFRQVTATGAQLQLVSATSSDRTKILATIVSIDVRLMAQHDRSESVGPGNSAPAQLHWVAHTQASKSSCARVGLLHPRTVYQPTIQKGLCFVAHRERQRAQEGVS